MTHPPARGVRRRLTPRPGQRRTASVTDQTPETRPDAAESPEPNPVAAGTDRAVPADRARRGLTQPGPTASTGAAGAADTSYTVLPGSGVGAPLLYTAEQAAALLQVRPSWLRRKAAARAVPCRFLGKHLRFSHADIETIANNSTPPSRHSS